MNKTATTAWGTVGFLQKIGYALILLFFLYSLCHIIFKQNMKYMDPDVQVITVSHWDCTPEVRAGYQAVYDRFEALKARQGIKVKVVQTSVPGNGYEQWSTTQLIGGHPTDLMAVHWTKGPAFISKYFVPLSPYIGKVNPFNTGTVLEGLAWNDSHIDNMEGAHYSGGGEMLDDYYKVSWTFFLERCFVNLDLLEKATGSRKLPTDLKEWLDICEKLKQYGQQTGQPIVPIACRGEDKHTIKSFSRIYMSQLTGNYVDQSVDGQLSRSELLAYMNQSPQDQQRVLAIMELMRDLGKYFGDGFLTITVEQALSFFISGNAGFYVTGSWEAHAMLNEPPFDVGVMEIPPVGHNYKVSQFYTGPLSEVGILGRSGYGITRASKQFDLALELLMFLTSYDMNLLVSSYCDYLPIVKKAKYEGPLQYFQPRIEGNTFLGVYPFGGDYTSNSLVKWVESMEDIIVHQRDNPGNLTLQGLRERKNIWLMEINEDIENVRRLQVIREQERSQRALALLRSGLSEMQRKKIDHLQHSAMETKVVGSRNRYLEMLNLRKQVDSF